MNDEPGVQLFSAFFHLLPFIVIVLDVADRSMNVSYKELQHRRGIIDIIIPIDEYKVARHQPKGGESNQRVNVESTRPDGRKNQKENQNGVRGRECKIEEVGYMERSKQCKRC